MRTLSRRAAMAGLGMFATGTHAAVPGLRRQSEDSNEPRMTSTRGLTGPETVYSKFASPGPYSPPDYPVAIEPVPGLRLLTYIPSGIRTPKVVVFSHAELAVPDIYGKLFAHWASHGFAVLAPLHDDSVFRHGLDAGGVDPLTHALTWDVGKLLDAPGAWAQRCRKCSDTLDNVDIVGRTGRYQLDGGNAIVAGHSFGALTAGLLTGVVAHDRSGNPIEGEDPRFMASLALSPNGRGFMGLSDGSWDSVSRPTMSVTGPGDRDSSGQTPDQKAEPFFLSPPGNEHLVWLTTVWPTLYSGSQMAGGSAGESVFRDVLSASTAFLHAYSEHDADTLAQLASGYFDTASEGRMSLSYR